MILTLNNLIVLIAILFGIPLLIGILLRGRMQKETTATFDNIAKALNFQKTDKSYLPREIKGVYNNKEITIKDAFFSRSRIGRVVDHCIRIEASFFDNSEPKLLTKSYFSLTRKFLKFDTKWNGFENSFTIIGDSIPQFDNETKEKIEYLFNKGYFNQFTYLDAWPPNKGGGENNKTVAFELPWKITEDISSLKNAIDIVVKVSNQMETLLMNKF